MNLAGERRLVWLSSEGQDETTLSPCPQPPLPPKKTHLAGRQHGVHKVRQRRADVDVRAAAKHLGGRREHQLAEPGRDVALLDKLLADAERAGVDRALEAALGLLISGRRVFGCELRGRGVGAGLLGVDERGAGRQSLETPYTGLRQLPAPTPPTGPPTHPPHPPALRPGRSASSRRKYPAATS